MCVGTEVSFPAAPSETSQTILMGVFIMKTDIKAPYEYPR